MNSTHTEMENRRHEKNHKSRYNKQKEKPNVTPTPLKEFLLNTNITDVWRYNNHTSTEYTHYSHAHGCFSRLDYILTPPLITTLVKDIHILPIMISDHAMVKMKINI